VFSLRELHRPAKVLGSNPQQRGNADIVQKSGRIGLGRIGKPYLGG
jgi:hypothetical protein